MTTTMLSYAALLAALSGCVSTGKYEAAVTDANQAHQRETALKTALATAEAEGTACRSKQGEAATQNEQLRAELLRRDQDADLLRAAKGELTTSLEQTRARLDELRRAQAAAEARAQLFRDLALKLKRMIDAGELQIVLRSGRMVLVLPNDILFDSGKAVIKPRGKETLGQIAVALSTFRDRRFQVAGHTDNEPIRLSGFASNWALSAERALQVTEHMIKSGMAPGSLSAAGYAEFDPVASNDLPDGKTKNRRTEITLQPNIDELVAVPATR